MRPVAEAKQARTEIDGSAKYDSESDESARAKDEYRSDDDEEPRWMSAASGDKDVEGVEMDDLRIAGAKDGDNSEPDFDAGAKSSDEKGPADEK
jgi:hypothetical protein